eukprot:TRINITY_DN2944_c0_g5_i1.p2 TRINITY_DN2944_c0_g5~~TRINITY_DN2944_c0_g5_i1.p2  ORF type:complete len:233 (-),score=19.69 TRINITY_DN2944_c0_g5_i1:201-899(-)
MKPLHEREKMLRLEELDLEDVDEGISRPLSFPKEGATLRKTANCSYGSVRNPYSSANPTLPSTEREGDLLVRGGCCDLCGEDAGKERMIQLNACHHHFQKKCIEESVRLQISLGKNVIECPASNCGKTIQKQELSNMSRNVTDQEGVKKTLASNFKVDEVANPDKVKRCGTINNIDPMRTGSGEFINYVSSCAECSKLTGPCLKHRRLSKGFSKTFSNVSAFIYSRIRRMRN